MGQITLKQVTKSFGDVQVIPPLDLTIGDGEFTVFVGPSGCGKSTLLRLIAGLEDITTGHIEIDGKDATDLVPAKRGLAMVFQSYALYPHMSVRKNIAFPLKMAKMDPAEIDKRINNAAAVLNLTDYLDRRPGQLSGGQRQRVAIGRAMVRDPAVFLFDEPLSNLDAQLRAQMRLEIKKLHQRVGNTIIFVTHDQVEAMTMADRIVIMKDGHIQQVGTPAEVYHKPANTFVARFIGAPSMNMLSGMVENGELRMASGAALDLGAGLPEGREIIIGVRPEDLHPGDGPALVRGPVTVREPLGHETLIYVGAEGQEVIAKADGRTPPQVGEEVTLTAAVDTLHIFDAATGDALR